MIHMEGNKGGGRRRIGVDEDNVSDGIQCINHPHRNNNNSSGICAFCLQEKLHKLLSSSSSPSFSSSHNSIRSNTDISSSSSSIISSKTTTTLAPTSFSSVEKNGSNHHREHYMRSRLPFLLARNKKNKKQYTNSSTSSSASHSAADIIFKRSKSTATPRRRGKFLDDDDGEEENGDVVIEDFNFSQRKRNWFWSFLHLSSNSSSSSSKKFEAKSLRENSNGSPRISVVNAASCTSREKSSLGASSLGRRTDMVVEEEQEEVDSVTSFERKVSRSKSVGCGSRSFSGDFFEKISTGFGDCTLRRVESQREGKTKMGSAVVNQHNHYMKEKVMCGGLFGGFMMTSSSSNSSSSSTYWVSSSNDDGMNSNYNNGESTNGRGSKSWGWAFSSPMRAFGTKTSTSKDNKKDSSDKNVIPNLSDIPSLLTVSS
ncbi:hypothetical protein Lalb_Chr18g0051571 [Lupinus albus]|uniref:Vitellogenin-like protein n=1 Tax=Lupinus albus TaxID=3870 RepID=A0A6A4P3N8_LUPAL|nr:hypothetical protein Lalb_Chr18g0051571 [Lupinus albus]